MAKKSLIIKQKRIRHSGKGLEDLSFEVLNEEIEDILSAGAFLQRTYDELQEIRSYDNGDDSPRELCPDYNQACMVLKTYFQELNDERNERLIARDEYEINPEDYAQPNDLDYDDSDEEGELE